MLALYIMESIGSGRREKADMILEPLQVMIQLALLSFSPVGTKISVSGNILVLQRPTFYQGVVRWYGGDTKDDLYYLFHAMRRYYKWYLSKKDKIFTYILGLAKKGIDRLIETYSNTDRISIIHTLALYKQMLEFDSAKVFDNEDSEALTIDEVFEQITGTYGELTNRIIYNMLQVIDAERSKAPTERYISSLQLFMEPTHSRIRGWIQKNLTC
jgi:hypothetical protein